jgi:branched-chain amino acid transport system permease protein
MWIAISRAREHMVLLALVAGLAAGLFDFMLPEYTRFLLARIALLVIVTLSLILLLGISGLLSLASAAFMGIGAYGISLIQLETSIPFLLGVVIVVMVAWLVGWVLGTISMRVSGFYLALTTLGLLIAFQTLVQHGGSLLGEGYGLVAPPPVVFGWTPDIAWISATATFVAAAVMVLTASLLDSRYGRSLRAMKANPVAAELCGVRLLRTRTSVFALSAGMGALAGCIYAPLLQAVSPAGFDILHTIDLLAYSVVGGMSLVLGALLGPLALELSVEYLRGLEEYRSLLFGGILMTILILAPNGLAGALYDLRKRVTRRFHIAPPPDIASAEVREDALLPRTAAAPDPAAPAIECRDVVVRYGGLVAVDGLSFSVERGHLHGLIGPNGAGKTTALNAITGLIRIHDGTISLGGDVIRGSGRGVPPWRLASLGVARTFQTPLVVPELTAAENVMLGLHAYLRAGVVGGSLKYRVIRDEERAARVHAIEALERVGFAGAPGAEVRNLAFGELRKLEIARAIVSKPRLLLLDEPTSGLEMSAAELMLQMLKGLQGDRDDALTIVIVEHNVPLLFAHCDLVTAMVDGRAIITGVADELRRNKQLRASYLGEQIEVEAEQHEREGRESDSVGA